MAPANALAAAARGLAGAATTLVLLVAGTLSWGLAAFRSYRRHERLYERNKTELEWLRADEVSSGFRAGSLPRAWTPSSPMPRMGSRCSIPACG